MGNTETNRTGLGPRGACNLEQTTVTRTWKCCERGFCTSTWKRSPDQTVEARGGGHVGEESSLGDLGSSSCLLQLRASHTHHGCLYRKTNPWRLADGLSCAPSGQYPETQLRPPSPLCHCPWHAQLRCFNIIQTHKLVVQWREMHRDISHTT